MKPYSVNKKVRQIAAKERLVERIKLLESDAVVFSEHWTQDVFEDGGIDVRLPLTPEEREDKIARAQDDLRNLNKKLDPYAA